jgi:polysaccharide chain length determinant protein (PEP-CTERM system associated)
MTPDSKKAAAYELLDTVFKSWWTVVAGVCLGLAAGLLALQHIPKVYEAVTKIRIAPQAIPDDFLQTTVTERLTQRRSELEESIERRSYMVAVLEQTGTLLPDEPSIEVAVGKLRENLSVRMPGDSNLFTLTLLDGEPQRAADLVNTLTRLYVDEHARSRATQAHSTRQTFDELATEAKQEFDVVDQELNEFNTQHRFETQNYLNANLKLLENGRGDLEANLAAQTLAQQRIQDLRGNRTRAATTSKGPPSSVPPESVIVDPQLERLALLEQELADLQARYSEAHPSVVRKRRQVEELQQTLGTGSPGPGTDSAGPADPVPADPRLAALNGQIEEVQRTLTALKLEEGSLRREVAKIERRIELTPQVQSDLNDLEERHRVLRERYLDYKQKAERSLQSEFLEESQRGQRLEVIEWAGTPFHPVFPNPLHVLVLALAIGVLLFVGPPLLRQALNPVVGSESGMRSLVDVPLLVSIPRVMTVENVRAARRRLLTNVGLSALSTAALAAAAVTVLS